MFDNNSKHKILKELLLGFGFFFLSDTHPLPLLHDYQAELADLHINLKG